MKDVSYSALKVPPNKLVVGYGRVRDAGSWRLTSNRSAFGNLPAGHTVIEEQLGVPDAPAGGLYSSAAQFAKLIMMLLNKGTLDGATILKPESVSALATFSNLWSKYGYQQGARRGSASPKARSLALYLRGSACRSK